MKKFLKKEDLYNYQSKAIDFIKERNSCALWVDMGLGKTIITLTAISDLLATSKVNRVLVIAPLRVARHTWPDQISSWEHTQHLSFKLITGTPVQRKIKLKSLASIHIINRELICWLVRILGKNWPYDMVIIDESSSFKSCKSKRFKALKKVLPRISRVIQLTGTPASNGLLDIWAQIFLLDRGERLGRSFSEFREVYFWGNYMGYSFEPRRGMEEKIYAKLEDICLTLSAEDYITMPERFDRILSLTIPQKNIRQYSRLEREFLLQLEEKTVAVSTPAALTNKLLQFSNGALYTDDEGAFEVVHDAKIDGLEEIVQNSCGQPLLVAYNFRSDLSRIYQRFPTAEHIGDNPDIIHRWNAGKIPILLAHPASACHGLNLQYGGNIVVWFGVNWSLELYQQFNARIYRQGQKKPVIIHHLIVSNSVDITVMEGLQGKYNTQKSLLLALKKVVIERIESGSR